MPISRAPNFLLPAPTKHPLTLTLQGKSCFFLNPNGKKCEFEKTCSEREIAAADPLRGGGAVKSLAQGGIWSGLSSSSPSAMNATMNWGKWKIPIIGWTGMVFAVWSMLYGFYWHDRTGHTIFWGDAIIDWVGDVVMLHWVKDYQTLLGGMLALLGALAILLSGAMQRRWALSDTLEQRRETSLGAVQSARTSFQRSYTLYAKAAQRISMMTFQDWPEIIASVDQIDATLAINSAVLGRFGEVLQMLSGEVRSSLKTAQSNGHSQNEMVLAAAICATAGAYLIHPDAFIDETSGRVKRIVVPEPPQLASVLEYLGVTRARIDKVIPLKRLFSNNEAR